jgi:hypothetical protein
MRRVHTDMSTRTATPAPAYEQLRLPAAPVRLVQLVAAAAAGAGGAQLLPEAETALVLGLALLAGVSSLWSP